MILLLDSPLRVSYFLFRALIRGFAGDIFYIYLPETEQRRKKVQVRLGTTIIIIDSVQ